jgi:hypothetical protein
LLCFIAVAVASGKDCFGDDRFPVVTQDGVVFFTGEAGRFALERRLRRIATQLYGMTDEEDDQLLLYVADERAILGSDRFLNALRTAIADHVPVLVEIDPLYPYVGSNTEAGNVFAVGEQLHAVSEICNEANVSLIVSHHPAEDGTGQHTDADGSDPGGRTRVGEGVVAGHHDQPNPAAGCAWLQVQVGGSEGYGDVYELELCVGAFSRDPPVRLVLGWVWLDEECPLTWDDAECRSSACSSSGGHLRGGSIAQSRPVASDV